MNASLGASVFGIEPEAGRFYPFAANLNYRAVQGYQLLVQVTACSQAPCGDIASMYSLFRLTHLRVQATNEQNLSSTMWFSVQVIYVNKPPFMANVTFAVSDAVVVPYIFSPALAAQDPQGLPVNYYIEGPEAANFSVNAATGVLTMNVAIDGDQLVPIKLNDSLGMTGYAWVNVRFVPVGLPSLLGISLPAAGFASTAGNENITLHGSNFTVQANYTAFYSSSTSGRSFNASSCVFISVASIICTTRAVSTGNVAPSLPQ